MRILILLFVFMAHSALAVEPHEMLTDPVQEARAREISEGLRCLVCKNESIDESNAELAADLRVLVRERIDAGDSNQDVINFVVARYGEFVLLRPTSNGANLVLWIAGPFLFLCALFFVWLRIWRQHRAPSVATLSPSEQARLTELIKQDIPK